LGGRVIASYTLHIHIDESFGERRRKLKVSKGGIYGKWAASKDEAKKVTDVYKHFFPLAAGLEDACVQGFGGKECVAGLGGYSVQIAGSVYPKNCCPKSVIDTLTC
jgi:hypothetical protein